MSSKMMPMWLAVFLVVACAPSRGTPGVDDAALSGAQAMEHVRALVGFGPRPPGSEALEKTRTYLKEQLKKWGYTVEEDAFQTDTPYGKKPMVNLIARTGPGEKSGVVALASHYDTKYLPDSTFVGANDGGSSTGLLLELARVLAGEKHPLDYWFVFLDGEEAFVEWSSFDSTYGSRHLARRWKSEGTASRIRALILLDMIGDKQLELLADTNSTRWLRELVWSTARESGLGGILSGVETAIEDDHLAFIDAGIPSVDLIDLGYGPSNAYWHTDQDTLDKLSPASLEQVGRLVLATLERLGARFNP